MLNSRKKVLWQRPENVAATPVPVAVIAPPAKRKKRKKNNSPSARRYQARRKAWVIDKADAEEVRAILVERFPLCFMPKGAEKKPLKIGIHRDVIAAAPDLDPARIGNAIRDYVTGMKYCRNSTVGAVRVDLAGADAGMVTQTEARAGARWAKMMPLSQPIPEYTGSDTPWEE